MKTVSGKTKKSLIRLEHDTREVSKFLAKAMLSLFIIVLATKISLFVPIYLGASDEFINYATFVLMLTFGYVTYNYKLGVKLSKPLFMLVFKE